jgi:hypothetical protein
MYGRSASIPAVMSLRMGWPVSAISSLVLRPIVQPFVLAVFHVQAHVLVRCAVGVELVRDHYVRRPRGLPEQLPHKPLRGDSSLRL